MRKALNLMVELIFINFVYLSALEKQSLSFHYNHTRSRGEHLQNILLRNEINLKEYGLNITDFQNQTKNTIIFKIISKLIQTADISKEIYEEYEKLGKYNLSSSSYTIGSIDFLSEANSFLDSFITFYKNNVFENKKQIFVLASNNTYNNKSQDYDYYQFILQLTDDELNFFRKLSKLKKFIEKILLFEKLQSEKFQKANNNQTSANYFNDLYSSDWNNNFLYIRKNLRNKRNRSNIFCTESLNIQVFCIKRKTFRKVFSLLTFLAVITLLFFVISIKKILSFFYKKARRIVTFILS